MTAPTRRRATVGAFCKGYGGLELALEALLGPLDLLWYAEYDEAASKVCAAHHPGVHNYGDIKETDWSTVPRVEILTAGFPCQDVSAAGRQAGLNADTRTGLWLWIRDAIEALQPELVVLENVLGLLSAPADRGMAPGDEHVEAAGEHALRAAGAVLGNLSDLGFDAQWITVPASVVGAPHLRKRVFILAWPAQGSGPGRFAARAVRLAGRRGFGGGSALAVDAESFGHGDPGAPLLGGIPAASVGGSVEAVGLLPTPAASRSGRQRSASPGAAIRPSLDSIGQLQPTPAARLGDRWGMPNAETAARRMGEEGRRNLDDAVALLPTPAARDWRSGQSNIMDRNARPLNEVITNLLPTPRTNAAKGAGVHGDGGLDLQTTVALLPTPRATDGTKGGPNQRGSSGDLMLPSAVMLMPAPKADDDNEAGSGTWGPYAAAIGRWSRVTGHGSPEPTEPGAHGKPRLSPRFVEWMMGLADGWVTAVPGLTRNDQLRILGNGVVWQQAAYALGHLFQQLAEPAADLGLSGEQHWREGEAR